MADQQDNDDGKLILALAAALQGLLAALDVNDAIGLSALGTAQLQAFIELRLAGCDIGPEMKRYADRLRLLADVPIADLERCAYEISDLHPGAGTAH